MEIFYTHVTVSALVSTIQFVGHITVADVPVDDHRLYLIIRPNWDHSICYLLVDTLSLELPSLIYISTID